jgi:hypothetical protein
MNVTVVIPKTLRTLVDGRKQLDLGVPVTADIGDVLQTLLSLYPRLRTALANEQGKGRQQLLVFMGERGARDLASGKSGLKNGDRLYLCATPPLPVIRAVV